MSKVIINNDSVARTWCGMEIQPSESYEIQECEKYRWANDSQVMVDIAGEKIIINDGDSNITDVNTAINHLKDKIAVDVIPTAPKNEYELKPVGIVHKHIDASNYVYDITLSNKSSKTYDYSCSIDPTFYDCIWGNNGELRDGVYSVDTENNTLTTFYGILDNASYKLSKAIDIDLYLDTELASMIYLWGVYFSASDYNEDDLLRMQIVDVDNILGYGANFIVKEYDECWVDQLNSIKKILTPDGAPGEIPTGLYLRCKYYPKDATKTNIRVWIDYIITVKS